MKKPKTKSKKRARVVIGIPGRRSPLGRLISVDDELLESRLDAAIGPAHSKALRRILGCPVDNP